MPLCGVSDNWLHCVAVIDELVAAAATEADWHGAKDAQQWSRDGRTHEKCLFTQNYTTQRTKRTFTRHSFVRGTSLQLLMCLLMMTMMIMMKAHCQLT